MQDELDILREVGSIAAAQASNALSEFMKTKITLSLPSIDIVDLSALAETTRIQTIAIAVICRIHVGLPGQIAMLLDEKNAFKVLNLSCTMTDEIKQAGVFTEIGLSFMKEVGNIAIGSYVLAMSQLLKKSILISIPTLINGPVESIMTTLFRPEVEPTVCLIRAEFQEPERNITGTFCLTLTQQAAAEIKSGCRKILEELENQA